MRIVTTIEATNTIRVDSDRGDAATAAATMDAWVAANHHQGYRWTYDPSGRVEFFLLDKSKLARLAMEAAKVEVVR